MTYFAKQYKNLKVIGKGTFAKVLLCARNSDNKQFAVKTYDKKKISASENATQTIMGIQNEIEVMQKLNHQNIIRLHEIYEGEFHIYLVLDLLTGGELFNKLQTKDSYSEKDACQLIKKLLSALEHMHSQGIMHRDIKPENLILKNENSETDIMLADFGLSESFKKQKLLFRRCGTPGYVAPEILNNQPYDTQVDIFSAGIILYIILTGYSPFFGDTYKDILEKNKNCKICFDFKKINVNLSPEDAQLLKHYHILGSKISKLKNLKVKLMKINIKKTKPTANDSNQMFMNSPLINGNTAAVNSPGNPDSPSLDSPQFNFIEKVQKKEEKKRSSAFSQRHQEQLQKALQLQEELEKKKNHK